MTGTVVAYGKGPASAAIEGGAAWIPVTQLEAATGWTLKPEGMCRADVCVPIPPGRGAEFVRDGRLDLLRFAEHMGQPVVREPRADLVVVGETQGDRQSRLATLDAPDFDLPDINGNPHRLSDYRGKKVLLVTWASW